MNTIFSLPFFNIIYENLHEKTFCQPETHRAGKKYSEYKFVTFAFGEKIVLQNIFFNLHAWIEHSCNVPGLRGVHESGTKDLDRKGAQTKLLAYIHT